MWAIPAGVDIMVMYTHRDLFEANGVPEPVIGWTDDRRLATLQQGALFSDLALIDVTDGQRTLLFAGSVQQATWSPSARLLAVMSYENEHYGTGLWLLDPDDPDPIPILLDGEHGLLSPR